MGIAIHLGCRPEPFIQSEKLGRPMAENERPGPDSERPPGPGIIRRTVAEPLVLLALATAALYVIGKIYLEAKFGALGLDIDELGFDFYAILTAALAPIIFPALLVLFSSLGCYWFSKSEWRHGHPLFPPIPAEQGLAVILITWAIKLLADNANPAPTNTWYVYQDRDVILTGIGLAAFLILYIWHRSQQSGPPWRLEPTTSSLFSLLSLFTGILLAAYLATGALDVKVSSILTLAAGWWFFFYSAIRDWTHNPSQRETKPTPAWIAKLTAVLRPVFQRMRSGLVRILRPLRHLLPQDSEGPRIAKRLFLVAILVIVALSAAALEGSKAASRLLEGCEAYPTVAFTNAPAPVQGNHTYWLVLRQGGTYYVREPSQQGANTTILQGTDALVAIKGSAAAPKAC